MALKKCKECGHEVSTKAKTCPNCGARIGTSTAAGCLLLVVILVAALIIGGRACNESIERTAEIVARAPTGQSPPQKKGKLQQEPQKPSTQAPKVRPATKRPPSPDGITHKGDQGERDAYDFVVAYGRKGWTVGNQIDGMVGFMRAQGDKCEVVDGQASRLRGDIFLVRCVVVVNEKEKYHYSWEANLQEQTVKPLSEHARQLHYPK